MCDHRLSARTGPGVTRIPIIDDFVDEHALCRTVFVLGDRHPEPAKNLNLGLVPQNLRIYEKSIHVEQSRAQSHPATLSHANHYGYRVAPVRVLNPKDAQQLVHRVGDQLLADVALNPLVNPALDRQLLLDSFQHTNESVWVSEDRGQITGHLYGAVIGDRTGTLSVWTGPDGVSFDDPIVLMDLHGTALAHWRTAGAFEHFVWCLSDAQRLRPWYELGYVVEGVRGSLEIKARATRELPEGYSLRRGRESDFDRCLELDEILDAAQGVDVRSLTREQRAANRDELLETLYDDETHLYVVEHHGRVIAQCVTYRAPARRGSFDHTIYLSEVVVHPNHEHRGVATAMIDAALSIALAHGF